MKSNGVKLSVCLIIKDEERVLGRVLSAAVQFADELIVVDTGSKDRSIEIAREYTDYVFSEPWQNSFARARNFAASKHGAISCLADTHHRCRVRGAGRDLRFRREYPEERAQKFNSVRCDSLRMSGVKLSGQEEALLGRLLPEGELPNWNRREREALSELFAEIREQLAAKAFPALAELDEILWLILNH